MRKLFILIACFSLLLTGWAFAGNPDLEGTTWKGTYDSIRPNGATFDDLDAEFTVTKQFGTLLVAEGVFENPVGDGPATVDVPITATAYISKDNRFFGIILYPEEIFGPGLSLVIQGEFRGKTMTGVSVDNSDGDTSFFVLKKE